MIVLITGVVSEPTHEGQAAENGNGVAICGVHGPGAGSLVTAGGRTALSLSGVLPQVRALPRRAVRGLRWLGQLSLRHSQLRGERLGLPRPAQPTSHHHSARYHSTFAPNF